jgi:hypothetical protein
MVMTSDPVMPAENRYQTAVSQTKVAGRPNADRQLGWQIVERRREVAFPAMTTVTVERMFELC